MSDTSCQLAHSDAAYVLGSLTPAERLEFERHLPGCAACRRSVAQLAGMPGLLGRVTAETLESAVPAEPVPDTVLPALVVAVRREQRRKTLLLSLGAAAAIAAVAVGASAIQAARDDARTPVVAPSTSASPTTASARPMEVVHDYGVGADVSLTQVEWGTKVGMTCRYESRELDYDGSHAYHYRLVVYSRTTEPVEVLDWWAKPGETISDSGTTAVNIGDITRVELQSDEGKTILRLKL